MNGREPQKENLKIEVCRAPNRSSARVIWRPVASICQITISWQLTV